VNRAGISDSNQPRVSKPWDLGTYCDGSFDNMMVCTDTHGYENGVMCLSKTGGVLGFDPSGSCGCFPKSLYYAEGGKCHSLGAVEGLVYPDCNQYDEIVESYSDCASGNAAAGWCVPEVEEEEDGGDAIMLISSAMTLDGLSVDAARAIEPAIIAGLADAAGVDTDSLTITGYAAVTTEARRLGAGTEVKYEIEVVGGNSADDVEAAVTRMASYPQVAAAVMTTIKAEVAASSQLTSALEAAGSTLDELDAVTATVAEPTVEEAEEEDGGPQSDSDASAMGMALVLAALYNAKVFL